MRYPPVVAAIAVCSVLLLGEMFSAHPASAVAPANDNLASAMSIPTPLPFSNTIADTTDATREGAAEPQCDLITDTVWYKHTPSSNVTLSADTFGSDFDTVLVVFTGPASSPTFGGLTLVACNDDTPPGTGPQSQIVFGATAGTTYYFQAGGVANGVGSLTFNLAVSAATPPANDNFLSAVNASPLPYANTRATAGATLEPAELRPCGEQIGATVWYKHTPAVSGTVTASSGGFDTVLAVYRGASLATLTLVGCDDDSGPGKASLISNLSVAGGKTYFFQAGGFDNATGNLTFNLSFVASPDTDGDGWPDADETTIGTNPALGCGTNAWPPDFNSDASVTGADLSAIAADIGKSVPPALARKDIGLPLDQAITGQDLSAVAARIGLSCTP